MAPDLVPAGEDDEDVVDAELVDDDPLVGGATDVGGPDLGALLGGLDMGSLLGAATEMQEQMLAAQAEAAAAEYEGQSGGGMVRVVVNGSMEFSSVTIDPEVVDPDDVEMLQDLVLAAVRDAVSQAVSGAAATMPAMPGMDMLGGLDLGSLFGGAAPGAGELEDDGDDGDDEDDDDTGSAG